MNDRSVVRSGVRIAYGVEGTGPNVALLPAWQLVDSRMWGAQVAGLRDQARVITHDARGSGRSGRPQDPAAYSVTELAADAVAVLDASATDRTILVGQSMGAVIGLLLAARFPERVAGLVLICPTVNLTGDTTAPIVRAGLRFERDFGGGEEGWERYNRHAFRRDFTGLARWFVGIAGPEPHAGPVREQAVAWALEQDPQTLATATALRAATPPSQQAAFLGALVDHVTCPVLVLHGARDAVAPPAWGAALAQRLDAEHVVMPDAGHCPHLTYPGAVNAAISSALEGSLR